MSSAESQIADIINPIESNTVYTSAEEVAIARNNGNEMMQQWIKQEKFGGEKGTMGVQDFLDTIEMTLMGMERHILDEAGRERAKALSLQSHLEGKLLSNIFSKSGTLYGSSTWECTAD